MQTQYSDPAVRVNRWFSQYPGSLLLEQERECIEAICRRCFGYYLLQVGVVGGTVSSLIPERLRVRVLVAPEAPQAGEFSWIRGRPDQIPVAGDSVDVVVMPHTLECYPDPHQTLREVDRILIPEGRLILTGFNPWSLWGAGWRLRRLRSKPPGGNSLISTRRMQDWLSLLGFEVEAMHRLMYRPPLRQQKLMARLELLERIGQRWWPGGAGVYVIEATKRVSTLTPIKPQWSLGRSLLGGRTIEPSTHTSLNRGIRRG